MDQLDQEAFTERSLARRLAAPRAQKEPASLGWLLEQACRSRDVRGALALLDKGADPNWKGQLNQPILFNLGSQGVFEDDEGAELARLLAARGADLEWHPKTSRATLLHICAIMGMPKLFAALLSAGADTGRKGASGQTLADIFKTHREEMAQSSGAKKTASRRWREARHEGILACQASWSTLMEARSLERAAPDPKVKSQAKAWL